MSDPVVISKKRFSDFEKISEGAFGTAYKACLKRGTKNLTFETVTIKILKNRSLRDAQAEINRMKRLDHPNVLKLIGISTSCAGEAPWIVTEFMQYGDLRSYILNYPNGSMTAETMIKFAYGIACGMKYLHHEVIQNHGDLAARNCLVGPNRAIKIGDFGRIDEDYEDHYYDTENGNRPFPIRWMPPENVPGYFNPKPKFNRKGDVWAYGVVLYEIWSRGALPYKHLDNEEVLQALEDEENPGVYYNVKARSFILKLMSDCWEGEPLDRPNFKQIKREFEENAGEIVNISYSSSSDDDYCSSSSSSSYFY